MDIVLKMSHKNTEQQRGPVFNLNVENTVTYIEVNLHVYFRLMWGKTNDNIFLQWSGDM